MTELDEAALEISATNHHDIPEVATKVVQEGVTFLNKMKPELPTLDPASDHTLIGDNAVVDSMGLVTYLNAVEGLLNSKFGINFDVISEKAMSLRRSPFHSTTSLKKYLIDELSKMEN